jgi:hypothetical protein
MVKIIILLIAGVGYEKYLWCVALCKEKKKN